MFPHPLWAEPRAVVQFTLQTETQGQQVFVGQVEAIASATGDRLKPQVLAEHAILRPAETHAPGDAAAGVTGQPEGAMARTELHVTQ